MILRPSEMRRKFSRHANGLTRILTRPATGLRGVLTRRHLRRKRNSTRADEVAQAVHENNTFGFVASDIDDAQRMNKDSVKKADQDQEDKSEIKEASINTDIAIVERRAAQGDVQAQKNLAWRFKWQWRFRAARYASKRKHCVVFASED